MTKPAYRSRPSAKPWSPISVILTLTVGMMVLVGLFHLITRIAAS